MDGDNLELACSLISKSYIDQGAQALRTRHKLVKTLLSERKLPKEGWDDMSIEALLQDLAAMDSNNFLGNVGVGEREGRVASGIVTRRCFGLSHGIGRSGDISAEQPKAAGSSLLAKLTNILASDAFHQAGLKDLAPVSVLPLATGMALTMTLLALKPLRHQNAKYVIWPRIDQKTCLKCIVSANMIPIVIENVLCDDALRTNVPEIERQVKEVGAENVICIMSTSSCFAPRGCDDLIGISKLCKRLNVPHIINNAYGVSSAFICRYAQPYRDQTLCEARMDDSEITTAVRKGRVDAIVQSTDKNFMVPVGGSVVAAPAKNPDLIVALNKSYPGRASASAHIDLFITLLHLGTTGWLKILKEREALFEYAKDALKQAAEEVGERLIVHRHNPISLAITLDSLCPDAAAKAITFLGSKLFTQCVSGTRVVSRGKEQEVAGIVFKGYGAHHDAYPHHYLTAAPFIGAKKEDVDHFVHKFKSAYVHVQSHQLVSEKSASERTID